MATNLLHFDTVFVLDVWGLSSFVSKTNKETTVSWFVRGLISLLSIKKVSNSESKTLLPDSQFSGSVQAHSPDKRISSKDSSMITLYTNYIVAALFTNIYHFKAWGSVGVYIIKKAMTTSLAVSNYNMLIPKLSFKSRGVDLFSTEWTWREPPLSPSFCCSWWHQV